MMSMHNTPLTDFEREGLEKHLLAIEYPSQLADVFRQGMAWALSKPQPTSQDNESKSVLKRHAVQKWKPSKGDISKIKMDASDDGKYVKYSDYLELKAATAQQNEWISVKDRLPELGEKKIHSEFRISKRVLVFRAHPFGIMTDYTINGEWSSFNTHWMPLPNPPSKE